MEEKLPDKRQKKQAQNKDDNAFNLFDNIVTNAYLKELQECKIVSFKKKELASIRWYRITKIVMEKDVFFTDQLSMLYIALHNKAKNVILALKKEDNGPIELYLGARDFEGTDCVSGEILESGLKGFLPGVDYEFIPEESFKKSFMAGERNLFKNEKREDDEKTGCAVSSVSVLASLRDDKKENFIQGIEKLINASDAIPSFTAYFIAENVSGSESTLMIQAFNSIQSQLSPFAECQRTFSESHTEGISENLTKGFSESVSVNLSKTVTHSGGWNYGKTITQGVNTGINANNSLILVGSGFHRDWNYSEGETGSLHAEKSEALQGGIGKTQAAHLDQSHGREESDTKGVSLQITHKNSQVSKYVDLIDKQVERLQKGIPFGLWSVATYFVAPEATTVLELANIYKGCAVGENSNLSVGAVNSWKGDEAKQVLGYLNQQIHPQFVYKGIEGAVSPGTIVTSEELAIHLSLPQASVPGILVREERAFGRNVPEELTDENSIDLGAIMYLGKEIKKNKAYEENEKNRVRIKVETLNKHVLVTGTTGSGKSNTLYQLILGLIEKQIGFLIIEPAKGEYKHVFGYRDDVSVYGSNPKKTPLLHINPFEFPKEIDVYQHIDALVEVFNACWPMYAAMPQVLSHSIIEAYKSCGWDMERSLNRRMMFPTIENVLDCLKKYINSSEYSQDTKGDYKGSLETRLQSLCDGTVGRIFKGESIPDEELFNSNVIIDLSEVRSSETNSLIMGLLVLKLNEFRSSENKGMNQKLKHITVLEEAHNLLKRTSTNQIAESSNVAGMAVEKISNSMAEMRTYGEGFVIADQSPSMLDLATIRNTNTKIIMALPEKDDRETAGKSIGLDDKHIEEISKLKTGEAIVYQSGWEEAVKAKIEEYKTPTQTWTYKPEESVQVCDDGAINKICNLLVSSYTSEANTLDPQELLGLLVAADTPVGRFNIIKERLENPNALATPEDIAFIFATMVGEEIIESVKPMSDITLFNAKISRYLSNKLGLANDARMNVYINMYMKGCSLKADTPFYEEWLQLTSKYK